MLGPILSRQMAALLGSGSDGGFFLLKGSCFFPLSPCAHSGWGIGSKRRDVGAVVVLTA